MNIIFSNLRRLALSRQGLESTCRFGKGLTGTRKAIEHLGYVQIDTLSVIERAHHHVLWNRVPGYETKHLQQLIDDKHIFEYWYHAASYLPIRDYRFALPQMMSIRNGENRYYNNADKKLMKEIMTRVRSEGELRLRDLDQSKKSKGFWWAYGPGKKALEKLFMQGDLMVSSRNGMEKIYDLSERCLPDAIDISEPTVCEYANYLFDTTLRAHGVFTWNQLLHLKTGKLLRDAMRGVLNERLEAEQIQVLDKENAPMTYVDIKAIKRLQDSNDALKILSPFDNAVIHRDRLSSLFNYDCRVECYVAADKRKYGYFCLPILFNGSFVGRIDCKAHRKEQRFEILGLHFEDAPIKWESFVPALNDELGNFADFNQCPVLDNKIITKRLSNIRKQGKLTV